MSCSYYGLTMWFPELFSRMESSNSTGSVCDTTASQSNVTTNNCANPNDAAIYFDTFLQAVSSLPGNILFFLLIDRIGRKVFIGESRNLSCVRYG